MRIDRHATLLALLLFAGVACHSQKSDVTQLVKSETAVAREARLEKALADHTVKGQATPLAKWIMPTTLKEISGLALTADGRLLTHGDEFGDVWEVDYRRGILVKHFSLGDKEVKGDFEGITVAKDVVFMVTSGGKIYQLHEGKNNEHVKYDVIETGLKKECEFESIAFDASINSLVLACKHVHEKDVRDAIVLYRWSLGADTTARLSKVVVPLGDVLRTNHWKNLHPSDITVDPTTGNYVLVASLEKALIEITPAGALVFARPLPDDDRQAEGVAVTKDGILIVSDEANNGPAKITLYRWP